MEFVPAKCTPEREFKARIECMAITLAGVLFIGLLNPVWVIELWSPDHMLLHRIPLPDRPACLLCKGQWVFCAISEGDILVLSAEDGRILRTIENAHSWMPHNMLALWGPYLISCGGVEGKVRWWRLGSWEAVQEQGSPIGHIWSLAVSPSGVLAVGGYWDIALFDAQNGEPRESPFNCNIQGIRCLLWQDELRLVSGSDDHDIRVWDVASRACLAILEGHDTVIYDLSRRGPILASASGDKTVRLWSLETHQCLQVLEGHRCSVTCVLFCGSRVLSGGNGGLLVTWEGGYFRMSKESLMTFLLCHKYGGCLPFSCIPRDIIRIIVGMVDEALMWGE